jgi:ABC-type glycerol-3-phosphate transport system permease component
MIDRREQALAYTILGVFSLIALLPIVGIVFTALQSRSGVMTMLRLRTGSATCPSFSAMRRSAYLYGFSPMIDAASDAPIPCWRHASHSVVP